MKAGCFIVSLLLFCATCEAQSFVNPSLENWAAVGTCQTNTPPDNWMNFSNAGLGPDEGHFPICPSTIPSHASDGNVYARMLAGSTSSGEGMAQTVSNFSVGGTYLLSFDYAGSNLWGGSDDIRFHIYLNNVPIDTTPVFSSGDSIWTHYIVPFTATSSTLTIGVRCCGAHMPSAGGSGGIDNFRIVFTTTGINTIDVRSELVISPNPFQNNLTISSNNYSDYEITLTDLTSRTVLHQAFSNGATISTATLAKGIYVFEVKGRNGIVKKGKLVKN